MVFDKKAQMMDAGMVLFPSDEPFGRVLGMVKTAMTPYGKVWRKTDLEGSRKKNRIYANSGKTVFCVDCGSGMGKPNDALGCLRLNDLKEFYA